MKQKLTKEQSRKLIGLGVPTEKASASVVEETQGNGCSWTYPVFTIGDLLEVLPNSIGNFGTLDIEYLHKGRWSVGYYCYEEFNFSNKELIDALFDIVVWCIGNGYIKTENK